MLSINCILDRGFLLPKEVETPTSLSGREFIHNMNILYVFLIEQKYVIIMPIILHVQ